MDATQYKTMRDGLIAAYPAEFVRLLSDAARALKSEGPNVPQYGTGLRLETLAGLINTLQADLLEANKPSTLNS